MKPSPRSDRPSGKAERLRAAIGAHRVALLVAVAYVVVFPYFPSINNPNENVRVFTTGALVEHGSFALEPVMRKWGGTGDRARDVHGRVVSSKAPGTSLLGVPVLWVHTRVAHLVRGASPGLAATTWSLRVFAVALPLAVFLVFFSAETFRATGSPLARDLLTLALGAGTMFFTYGVGFMGHALGAAAVFAAFLLVRRSELGPRGLALAGGLAGRAVVFEYQVLIVVAIVTVFAAVLHRRRVAAFLAGAAPPALLLAGYHTLLFGAPWAFPYGHLDDPDFQEWGHGSGFFGLHRPRPNILKAVFFDVDYGLFVFSPFLAFGVVAATVGYLRDRPGDAVENRRRRHEQALCLGAFVAMALFLTGMANWRGGWCAGGPRYIAAAVPFAVWGIARAFADLERRPPLVGALFGLVLAGVFACGLSAMVFPHYPLQFDNPVFEVALRLVRDGYAPGGLGAALGLPGGLALAPPVLALLTACAFVVRSIEDRRSAVLGVAALVAVVIIGGLSVYGRYTTEAEANAYATVRQAAMGGAR